MGSFSASDRKLRSSQASLETVSYSVAVDGSMNSGVIQGQGLLGALVLLLACGVISQEVPLLCYCLLPLLGREAPGGGCTRKLGKNVTVVMK